MMPNLFLILFFLFLAHRPPHLLPVARAQLLGIDNEVGGIDPTKTPIYIVHVAKPPRAAGRHRSLRFMELKSWYMSFLPNSTLGSGEPRMVYAYREVMSGFAARLTPEEAQGMKDIEGFITAYPDQELHVSTTYTPSFLGLKGRASSKLWAESFMGTGQIIGVIDTGIIPNHPSFEDDGMPPPPTKWGGKCFWGNTRTCNNKLIGAVGFRSGTNPSPVDTNGHGTHVASIAAGNFVDKAHVNGQAFGTASGIAPRAHIAAYKVFFSTPSGQVVGDSSDVLAAIDQAIRDKVDILQMSIESFTGPLHQNAVAIGSFAAITKDIVPCAAAGNSGPVASVLANDAPWILTVGASTTDRRIVASVLLGNGSELIGESAYRQSSLDIKQWPLSFPFGELKTQESIECQNSELVKLNLRGKIVMCFNPDKGRIGSDVKSAGAAAMVLMNKWKVGETTNAYLDELTGASINFTAMKIMTDYYTAALKPTAAIIFNDTHFGFDTSPAVADFSSRGPSLKNGGIIKPDVIAPGVNIIAAWPKPVGPTPTNPQFNFKSGTSMAAPHVSGVVALLRNKHPTWSPAMIKSAIMTTAYTVNRKGEAITDEFMGGEASVFARGSGHVDPEEAANPGLVYELDYYNYVHYLCGYFKSDSVVQAIIRGAVQCSQVRGILPEQLNYPSFSVNLGGGRSSVTVRRRATNVGDAQSVYNVNVDQEPDGVRVVVKPTTLQFTGVGQEQSYDVVFSLKTGSQAPAAGEVKEGSLNWDSGKYLVVSPISVTIL